MERGISFKTHQKEDGVAFESMDLGAKLSGFKMLALVNSVKMVKIVMFIICIGAF